MCGCARSVFPGEFLQFIALVCESPDSQRAAGAVHGCRHGSKPLPQPGSDHPPETALGQTSWAHSVSKWGERRGREVWLSWGLNKEKISLFRHWALSTAAWEDFLLRLHWKTTVLCECLGKGLHSPEKLPSFLLWPPPAQPQSPTGFPLTWGCVQSLAPVERIFLLVERRTYFLSYSPENLQEASPNPLVHNHIKMRFCRGAHLLLLL